MRQRRRLLVTCCLFAAAAVASSDMNGNWKLDGAKSDFGPLPPPETMTWKVTHREPVIEVDSAENGMRGEIKGVMKYSTDGTETVNTVAGVEIKSTTKWEENILRVVSKLVYQGNNVTLDDKISVSEDGKMLTIDRQIVSDQGEAVMKIVLVKE